MGHLISTSSDSVSYDTRLLDFVREGIVAFYYSFCLFQIAANDLAPSSTCSDRHGSLRTGKALFTMLFALSRTVVSILGLAALPFVTSAPASNSTSLDLSTEARDILSRAVPSPPVSRRPASFWRAGTTTGIRDCGKSIVAIYSQGALAFLLVDGAFDKAKEWTRLSAAQRARVKAEYAAAGIKLIVSVFGATDAPTTNGADPVETANEMADWVKKFDLDGIDVDYEVRLALMNGARIDIIYLGLRCGKCRDGKAEAWVISFTRQLRVRLPQGKFILTHARMFSPNKFGGGAYVTINKAIGHLIDWYNLQRVTLNTPLARPTVHIIQNMAQIGLFQIASSGIPFSKLVIGKPATSDDASNGFMSTSELATCVQEAKRLGWVSSVTCHLFGTRHVVSQRQCLMDPNGKIEGVPSVIYYSYRSTST
ncbi:glycoside hydrolase [Salix suchowensis]|nr:glycoside hydrolase [Salix suchowensis]